MGRTTNGIETPCIDICVIDPAARLCSGCLRSIDEITMWSQMTPEARRAVMEDLPARAPLVSTNDNGGATRHRR